ncbi:uncharacterized protein LOC124643145 isoform X2 [Helicoverpa zea]|uniref:uncharacterized protein LOC124643145 isoform X2 n=1 Tax=Helicoverpa zea TaxID=7113 RepID=UPI001F598512|nr:uncharacterized protein LOC124643145 isoform X2 [Helicoverpa zea]
MRRPALALAVLCRAALALPQPPSTDKPIVQNANKSLEFVNIIKQDLRRDNDDYAMLEQNRLQAAEPSPPPSPPPVSTPPALSLPPALLDARKGMNMRSHGDSKHNSKVHSKHHKKVDPLDKLKQFMDKNKIRAGGTTPPAPPLPLSTGGPLRAREPPASPSPDQLDMAAARGPQVSQLRFKGRLCQRSVMALEGPTYDRLGKQLRGAFNAAERGRQFHHTAAPKLLLPRCCNCCKKSVLGCQ